MNIQLRIRTDGDFAEILFIKDWVNGAFKCLAFEHDKPGNHHYHIYLFGLERNPDAMRKLLGRYLNKECYSVSTTCGGRKLMKITQQGAWQYGTEKELKEPVFIKGFTDEEIKEMKSLAEVYYKPVEAVLVTREDHYVVRPDKVWQRLHEKVDDYKDKSVKQIKSMMCAEWLRAGKAIPRTADLHRYAMSLYMLNKFNHEVPDSAFEDYFE